MKQDVKGRTSPKVDGFLRKPRQWLEEIKSLRAIALDCGLTEDMKWGQPCYTRENSNIVLIHGFKEYCALLFFKGALLKDAKGILVQQTQNVQAARQLRFTTGKEIVAKKAVIKAYIREAIEVEKAGLKVDKKKTADFAIPVEFQDQLDEMPELKIAFAALTPGRQRGYLLYFASARQAKTRESRVEKWIGAILDGRGLDDE